MTIEIPEKCPKCGAEFLKTERDDWGSEVVEYTRFKCETTTFGKSVIRLEGLFCITRQRDILTKRVAELEEALRKVQFYGATGCLQDSLDEAKRIAEEALNPVASKREPLTPSLDLMEIPRKVTDAALSLERYFESIGVDRWELMGVASRKR